MPKNENESLNDPIQKFFEEHNLKVRKSKILIDVGADFYATVASICTEYMKNLTDIETRWLEREEKIRVEKQKNLDEFFDILRITLSTLLSTVVPTVLKEKGMIRPSNIEEVFKDVDKTINTETSIEPNEEEGSTDD